MASYKILIIEDDENAAKYIQTCLSMGNTKARFVIMDVWQFRK